MAKSVVRTKYRLQIGNPLKVYGAANIFLGFLLLLIAYLRMMSFGSQTSWTDILEELVTILERA